MREASVKRLRTRLGAEEEKVTIYKEALWLLNTKLKE